MEEERYWLRHPSLRGLLGPYRLNELRAALAAESFPADSYALRDAGQTETELRASPHWRPVTDVLGMPRPPESEPAAAAAPPPLPAGLAARLRVRAATAYPGLRTAVTVIAWITGVALVVVTLLSIGGGGRALTGTQVAVALGYVLVEVLAVIVIAGVLQALFDIADCSLRRDQPRGGGTA